MSTSLPPRQRRGNSHMPPPIYTEPEPEPKAPLIEETEALPVPDSFSLFVQSVLDHYTIHPFADMGTIHPEHVLSAIADSIARDGQELPITYDQDGRIVDGRNRLIACAMVNVEPVFVQRTFENDEAVAAFIRRLNIRTGERTVSQRLLWDTRLQYETDDRTNFGKGSERTVIFTVDNEGALNSKRDHVRIKNARILVHAEKTSTDEALKGEALRLIGEIQKGMSIEEAIKEWYSFNHVDHSESNDKRFLYERAPDLAEMVDLGKMKLGDAVKAAKDREEVVRGKITAGKQAIRELYDITDRVNTIMVAVSTIDEGIGLYQGDTLTSVIPTETTLQQIENAVKLLREAYNRSRTGGE